MGASSSIQAAAPPPGSWNRGQNDLRTFIKTGSSNGVGGPMDATKSAVKGIGSDSASANTPQGAFVPRYNVGTSFFGSNQRNDNKASIYSANPVPTFQNVPGAKTTLGS